jgi:hypothetical protein
MKDSSYQSIIKYITNHKHLMLRPEIPVVIVLMIVSNVMEGLSVQAYNVPYKLFHKQSGGKNKKYNKNNNRKNENHNIIENYSNHLANTFMKASIDTKNMANNIIDQYIARSSLRTSPTMNGGGFIEDSVSVVTSIVGKTLHSALSETENLLGFTTKNEIEKLDLATKILNMMSKDPAMREAIKKLASAGSESFVIILKDIEPEILKVSNQIRETITKTADKSIRGFVSSGLSVAQAAVAEVPVVGGVVDLLIAAGKSFNNLMVVVLTLTESSGKVAITSADTIVKAKDAFMKGEEKLSAGISSFKDAITGIVGKMGDLENSATSGESSATAATAATAATDSDSTTTTPNDKPDGFNKSIMKGGKRIHKSLHKFYHTASKPRKLYKNYTKKYKKNHKKTTLKHKRDKK